MKILKILYKQELQQIAVNHSIWCWLERFYKYKKCTGKPYSFLVNDATLPLDSPLYFRQNLWNKSQPLIKWKTMYNITEAAKISAVLGKIDKYGYLTGKKKLFSGPSQIIEQVKFTYFSLEKSFE